jgi:hypothetical protein
LIILQREYAGAPARALADAACPLKRAQKRMPQERVALVIERIPLRAIDGVDAFDDLGAHQP